MSSRSGKKSANKGKNKSKKATDASDSAGSGGTGVEYAVAQQQLNDMKEQHVIQARQLEELQSQLAAVRGERNSFAAEIQQLKTQMKEEETEKVHMVSFLKQDLEASIVCAKEKEELAETRAVEIKEMQEKYERALRDLKNEMQEKHTSNESELRQRTGTLEAQLRDVEAYQRDRSSLMARLDNMKESMESREKSHKTELMRLERKFVAARDRMLRDSAAQIDQSRGQLTKEIMTRLDRESLAIREKNQALKKELAFQEKAAENIQVQNDHLRSRMRKIKMEMELHTQKDTEYAKRGVRQSKTIRDLTDKVKLLETSLAQAMREFEEERDTMVSSHQHQVDDLSYRLEHAVRELSMKEKELSKMKKVAKSILRQRSEVEQFFLEALDQVKQEISAQRQAEFEAAKTAHKEYLRTLAGGSLSSAGAGPNASSEAGEYKFSDRKKNPYAKAPSTNVDLRDLCLEDRERVLRLLFAKINHIDGGSRKSASRNPVKAAAAASPKRANANAALNPDALFAMAYDQTFVTNCDPQSENP
jgi:basal body-orientation factor 1